MISTAGTTAQAEPSAVLIAGVHPILRATALRLAKRRMPIAVCDASKEALRTFEAELRREGCVIFGLPGRIADAADAGRVVEAVTARFGQMSVLVNGFVDRDADPRAPTESETQMAVMRRLNLARAVIPRLVADRGGRIINLVTSAGRYRSAYFRTGNRSRIVEAVDGGAMLALTRQLAFELAPERIRVNAVVVGLIEEETVDDCWSMLTEHERRFVFEEISLGRLGKPDEAAAAIEFLASEASSYLTGTAIDVNGGWWMS